MRFSYENRLWKKGLGHVAGVDEVGRGPLAGPIVAAAVILSPTLKIRGLADSKLLTPRKREELSRSIRKESLAVGIGIVSHRGIDRMNIGRANLLAMKKAVGRLRIMPDFILIDGARNRIDLALAQRGICGGDRKCASIAAASIVAKVARDRIMRRYHARYPEYRFDLHKGYGTPLHLRKLKEFGPCLIHRRSFRPVSAPA